MSLLHRKANQWQKLSDAEYIERLKAACIVDANGCWLYQGFLHPKGYGQMSYRGKAWRVHRLSFFLHKGPIPPKHHVCHTCDVRHCCSPDHLWAGTNRENMVDASRKGRADRQWMTHCHRGHEFTPENTYYIDTGLTKKRDCRTCNRIRMRLRAGWSIDEAEAHDRIPQGYSRDRLPSEVSNP